MSQEPKRCCDLVMKGGITSGVLYPSAVKEIAHKFYFVGIAGTSAGAIAACATAAAEYRRRHTGSFEGFALLEKLAGELGEPGVLLNLFRPDRETRKLFKLLLRFIEGKAGAFAKIRLATKVLFNRERTFRCIADNGFGLASGMANGNRDDGSLPISEWLAAKIDELAGKTDGPLTLADLHAAPIPEALRGVMRGLEDRSIDLRAVTTSLSFGRPLEIPFKERIFAFDPDQWKSLFPAYVVEHLVREAEKLDSETLKRDGKLPLPVDSLPVVVAARMSLSFPLLFSAVPLYAVNYHREDEPLAPVWFSDGGITSNFPMHRFDSLYPRWPTLGLNLMYTDESERGARRSLRRTGELVHLPKRRSDAVLDLWHELDAGATASSKIFGFLGAIFRSAQVWHDYAFLKLPGYRDRAVEIWLKPDEGGLNLTMGKDKIDALVHRGAEAGRLIAERFSAKSDDSMSWDGHRWTRFRSGIAGLVATLIELEQSTAVTMADDTPLLDFFASKDTPPAYKFNNEDQRRDAEALTKNLLELARSCQQLYDCQDPEQAEDGPFCDGPRPRVENGSRAPF